MDRVRAPAPLRRVLPPGHRSRPGPEARVHHPYPRNTLFPNSRYCNLISLRGEPRLLGSELCGERCGMGDKVRHARLELYVSLRALRGLLDQGI